MQLNVAMTTLYLDLLKQGHSNLFIEGVAKVSNTACVAGKQGGNAPLEEI